MAIYLNQLEREWLSARVTGATAQTPLNQLKRNYYIGFLGPNFGGAHIWELETAWLTKYISEKGGVVGDNLWASAVSLIGQVPTVYLNQNKILFYLHAGMDLASFSPSGSASASPSPSA